MKVLLLVGTRKGAFVYESDEGRRDWRMRAHAFPGMDVHHVVHDPRTDAIYAAVNSWNYGAMVARSDDLGATWTQSSEGITYGESSNGAKVSQVWHVQPGHADRPGEMWAGVQDAGLFHSGDGGQTWAHVAGLRAHETAKEWAPGAGGLCLHTILIDQGDPQRMFVAISAGGLYGTEDGGATWRPLNAGVPASWRPEPEPIVGQCVHKVALCGTGPRARIYQQNHLGQYRSDDAGVTWRSIAQGLPSTFGFPVAVHPRDPQRAYVLPLNADERRFAIDAAPALWRTCDGGEHWERLANGLPARDAYMVVLRDALGTDALEPVGLYVGTTTGQVYVSADEGERWSALPAYLPPIQSVETATVA